MKRPGFEFTTRDVPWVNLLTELPRINLSSEEWQARVTRLREENAALRDTIDALRAEIEHLKNYNVEPENHPDPIASSG